MRHSLAVKQRVLRLADVVIGVSRSVSRDLQSRSPGLARAQVETIPNMVDVEALERQVAATPHPLGTPYAVYVGKLAANKGSGLLPDVIRRAKLSWPLVVIGDGPGRVSLEAATRNWKPAVRFTGWLPRESVWQWVGHANLLIFPSTWREPLSRVLLEACAMGVPIAAMNTGGTGDILTHDESALLSYSAEELGDHIRRLVSDRSLRDRLRVNARHVVTERFAAPIVLDRIEALYQSLVPS
jgi:glycosyltransferase involved in cell wall biosynthesis